MPGSGGQWGLHFWSHRSETIGERVFGRLPFPRSYTDNGLKHTLSLSMNKAHLLVLELRSEGLASGLPHM